VINRPSAVRTWSLVVFGFCMACGSKPAPVRDVNGYGPPGRCFQQPTELELEGPGGQFAQNFSNLPPCPPREPLLLQDPARTVTADGGLIWIAPSDAGVD